MASTAAASAGLKPSHINTKDGPGQLWFITGNRVHKLHLFIHSNQRRFLVRLFRLRRRSDLFVDCKLIFSWKWDIELDHKMMAYLKEMFGLCAVGKSPTEFPLFPLREIDDYRFTLW